MNLSPGLVPHSRKISRSSSCSFYCRFSRNELVAEYRIKVGKDIGSKILIADGYRARADGFASLAVLLSVSGLWMGYPIADPVIGLFITLLILQIV